MAVGNGRERIFLYGTLRRRGTRDVLAYYGGAEFVGMAHVRGVLYDFHDYPGLRLVDGADWVIGEIFDVTPETLAQLDDWEAIDPAAPDDGEYRRVKLHAQLDDGSSAACWGYEVSLEKSAGQNVIASGDWIAHNAARS